MRHTRSSLFFALTIFASLTPALGAQSRTRFGDTWPTTDLTPAQSTFAKAYLAAITGSDIERYKKLLHPATRACINAETAAYFQTVFDRRVGRSAPNAKLSVETLPAKFAMFDAFATQGMVYPVRPTHAFYIDLVSTRTKDESIIAFSELDQGVWYEVLPCPTAKALDDMKKGQAKNAVEMAKARDLAASIQEPLRAEMLALIKGDRQMSAAKRYSDATHVDFSMARRVVDALVEKKQ
ncbi:MAG: hypothetical protein QOD47_1539 [Gemmatimonadaceae bacterium]|nr:hypothetical protein [Gemmatimonadaceae bacterium]